MKYRTTLGIYRDMLQFCADSSRTRTKVMYGSQISYAQVKAHLPELISAGLIKMENNQYFTTPKGYEYIETFSKLEKFLEA